MGEKTPMMSRSAAVTAKVCRPGRDSAGRSVKKSCDATA